MINVIVDFENETDFMPGFEPQKLSEDVIRQILIKEKFPIDTIVSLTITDDDTVRQINKEYRNIDKTTDVLSFPNTEWDSPSDYECEGFRDRSLIDPENGCFMLGQIVLNESRIVSQADEYGHSVKREYAFLIAHSVLHLLGYDHMEPEEAAVMEQKQRDYLEDMGISR